MTDAQVAQVAAALHEIPLELLAIPPHQEDLNA
jgi:hypothetical protein